MPKICSFDPNLEVLVTDADELAKGISSGYTVVLKDKVEEKHGRSRLVAVVKGGDVIVQELHDSKNDGNWHPHEGVIMPKGSIPKLIGLLAKRGYGPDGSSLP
jgi:hypothetical protein